MGGKKEKLAYISLFSHKSLHICFRKKFSHTSKDEAKFISHTKRRTTKLGHFNNYLDKPKYRCFTSLLKSLTYLCMQGNFQHDFCITATTCIAIKISRGHDRLVAINHREGDDFKVGMRDSTPADCHKINKKFDQVVSVSEYIWKSITVMFLFIFFP